MALVGRSARIAGNKPSWITHQMQMDDLILCKWGLLSARARLLAGAPAILIIKQEIPGFSAESRGRTEKRSLV